MWEPSPASARPWRWFEWSALVAVSSGALLLRPDAAAQRFTIGSEDGSIFTRQVRALGVWPSFHTTYAGYLHLLPRVAAAIASAFSLRATPVIYVVGAAVIGGASAVIAARCVRGMGLSRVGSVLIGAAVVVLPAAGWEVPLELTNVQWYVAAAFVVFVASWMSGYRPPVRWVVSLLLIAGLTSPLLAVSLPFVVLTAGWRRERLDAVVAVTIAVTAFAQVLASVLSYQATDVGHWNVVEIVREYGARVVLGAFIGARSVPSGWATLGLTGTVILAGAAVAALVGIALYLRGRPRLVSAYLLFASVAYLAVSIIVRPSFFHPMPIGQIVIDGRTELWDGRYMAAPATALVLLAVLFAERLLLPTRLGRWVAAVVAAVFVLVLAVNFPVDLHHDTLAHWDTEVSAQQATCVAHGEHGSVTIVYGPFTTHPVWTLVLTCRQAFG